MRSKDATILSLILAAAFVLGCNGEPRWPTDGLPKWLQTKIGNLELEPNVPVYVSHAKYNGATVYYISATRPDGYGCLFDADGTAIGCPDGGVDGKGDGTCSDYFDTRTDEVFVWKSEE